MAQVPGGVGGRLDFMYEPGNATLVAPTTVGGMRFEFWYVVLPSQQEKMVSNQFSIYLPAGFAPGNSFIEAFYG
jgi:hypothetical protein